MPHPFPTRYWLLSFWGSWAAASVVQFSVQIKYHFLGVPWYKKSQEALCKGPSQGEKVLCKAGTCLFAHVRSLLVTCIFKGEHKDLLLTSCQAHLILSFFTPQGVHRNTPSSILWICLYLKSPRCISTLIWENYSSQLSSLYIFRFLPLPIL